MGCFVSSILLPIWAATFDWPLWSFNGFSIISKCLALEHGLLCSFIGLPPPFGWVWNLFWITIQLKAKYITRPRTEDVMLQSLAVFPPHTCDVSGSSLGKSIASPDWGFFFCGFPLFFQMMLGVMFYSGPWHFLPCPFSALFHYDWIIRCLVVLLIVSLIKHKLL